MIPVDVLMTLIDFDFEFVEYGFCAYELVTGLRVCAPYNGGRPIKFHRQLTRHQKSIQYGEVSCKDAVFGVSLVNVFHTLIIEGGNPLAGVCCDSLLSGYGVTVKKLILRLRSK